MYIYIHYNKDLCYSVILLIQYRSVGIQFVGPMENFYTINDKYIYDGNRSANFFTYIINKKHDYKPEFDINVYENKL